MARQRDRGRILTDAGKEKIKQAIRAWEFEHERRCTQEQLKELTGLDPSTSSKILNAKGGADRSKIEDFFRAFGLQLEEADLRSTQTISAPEPNPNFVGREDAIADLNALVRRGAKLIVIQARGGVGKTTLAWEYLKTQGFDLVLELWMAKETQNIASVEGVIEEWLRRYFDEEPGREFGVTLERLRQKLRDPSQKIGILIDNLEPALDQSGRFIEAHRRYVELMRVLSDRAAQSVTLVTSRERLQEADFGIEHYLLRSLEQQAWKQFFEHYGIQQDESALAELHRAYGGNAKAMEILRSVVQADFSGNLAAYWQANQGDLFVERALEDLVAQQFERLQQHDLDAYKLLCRMGCYRFQDVPTVPSEGLICLLWDVPENRRRRVVKLLIERSLIEIEEGQFSLHPSIQAEAVYQLKASRGFTESHRQAAKFWTGSISTIETVEDALIAFEAYYHYVSIDDLEQAAYVILETRNNDTLRGIVREDLLRASLGNSFHRLGLTQQIILAMSQIVDSMPIGFNLSLFYNILGDLYKTTGKLKKAIYCHKKSGEIAKELNIIKLELVSLVNLGLCNLALWEIDSSIELFENGNLPYYRISTNVDVERFTGVAFSVLAFLYSISDNYEKARSFADQAYESLEKVKLGIRGTAYRLYFLGEAFKSLGEQEKALEMYQRTISFSRKSYFNQLIGITLTRLAEIKREQGEFSSAIQIHLESIENLDRIGAAFELAEAYYQLGLTYQARGDDEKKETSFQKAIQLFIKVEAPKQVDRVERSRQYKSSNE